MEIFVTWKCVASWSSDGYLFIRLIVKLNKMTCEFYSLIYSEYEHTQFTIKWMKCVGEEANSNISTQKRGDYWCSLMWCLLLRTSKCYWKSTKQQSRSFVPLNQFWSLMESINKWTEHATFLVLVCWNFNKESYDPVLWFEEGTGGATYGLTRNIPVLFVTRRRRKTLI